MVLSIKYVVLRRSPLAPFNVKCLFLILKILTKLQKELPNQTVYPHYYYLLLLALRFLGELYNFHHFVIIFSLIKSQYVVEERHILQIPK